MKTLKTTALALTLMVLCCFNLKAGNEPETKANQTLNKYIEGATKGKTKGISSIFDEKFKLGMLRGDKPLSYSKAEFLQDLQNSKGVTQQCETSYSIIENNANFVIARVEMKYPTFTRVNCVSLNNTPEGWKITNISTTFK
jgi:hypothetical protein